MIFDKNQKEFPSSTHKSIWHAAVFMAPYYKVVPTELTGKEADDLREGGKSLYSFMTDLYSEMYENPEKFYIPVEEYDNFMKGRSRNDLIDKEKQKEGRLRNKFQQSIQFYQKLLFEIGARGNQEAGSYDICIDESIMSDIIKVHKLSQIRGEQEKRLNALSDMGMQVSRSEFKLTFSNSKYPKMFTALSALCKAGNKSFAVTNFLRCDLRGLIKSHKPGFQDSISILPDDFMKAAAEMYEFMRGLKCWIFVEPLKNTTLHSEWKVSFKFNGQLIYSFHSDAGTLKTFAYFNRHDNVSRMGYVLKEESEPLYKWFCDRVPVTACSCPNNKLVDIGGCKKRICGLMNRIDVINPDKSSLENLKRTIETYIGKVMK